METKTAIHLIDIVAQGLGDLHEQVVFVGGATTALYFDNPTLANPRPTDDVDCAIEISTRKDYYKLEDELRKLGFKNQVGQGVPLCRWSYSGITVDIMPTDKKILGFSNSWYPSGIASAEKVRLPSRLEVSIFSLPYFIASKFEAFANRGKGDLRLSSDFEDIVFVLDGCRQAEQKLNEAPSDVRTFLKTICEKLAVDSTFAEAIAGHLENDPNRAARTKRVMNLLKQL
jgi:predicted nucleotidyltransferase